MQRLLYLLPFLLLLSNCQKEPDYLFKMEYEQDFEIAAGLNTFVVWYFEMRFIPSNADDFFTAFGADINEAGIINPGRARLSTIFSDVDYDFIEDISVRIYQDDPDEDKEIFYRDNLPFNTGRDIDLFPTLVDVSEFVLEERFNVRVRMVFRQNPPQFVDSRLTFDFLVN